MHFREDLKSTSEALSDILKATPKPDTPAVAPDYSERELVVVPSTKPSAPPSTTTVVTTPTSPLRHVFLFIHSCWDLDRFTESEWLIHGAGTLADLGFAAAQASVYTALLGAAAMFDLHRRAL